MSGLDYSAAALLAQADRSYRVAYYRVAITGKTETRVICPKGERGPVHQGRLDDIN